MEQSFSKQILNELKEMKLELNEIKQEQLKTNERLDNIESKQNFIYNQTGKLSENHEETLKTLENLATKDDLEYFDKKITQSELFEIDKQFSTLTNKVNGNSEQVRLTLKP